MSRSKREQRHAPRRDSRFVFAAILVCAAFWFAYAQTGGFQFVQFDDPAYVTANDHVNKGLTFDGLRWALTSLEVYWQPATWFSHMLDVELFGMNPGPQHLMSALLQALTACLLFLWLDRLSGRRSWSLMVTAIWVLHPLRVESVAWIAERKDVLSGLFGMAALLLWRRYVQAPSVKRYLAAFLAFLLALMSKPALVVLPLALLLLDYWPLRRNRRWRDLVIEKMPMLALSGAVGIATYIGQRDTGAFGFVQAPPALRIGNAAVSAVTYLGKMFWPVNLAAYYPYPKQLSMPLVAACGGALLAITALVIWQRRQRPYLLVGWSWYIVMLLPAAGLIQAGGQAMADRFTYWPMIGIVWALVWLAADLPPERHAVWACAAILLLLTLASWRQAGYWRDSLTLFERALAVGGDSDFIRGNLANSLMSLGRDAEAEPHLEAAVREAPGQAWHHYNLALVRLKLGRAEEARSEAEMAARLAPNDARMRELAAIADLKTGRYQEGIAEMRQAIARGADRSMAASHLNDAGVLLAQQSQWMLAEQILRAAVEINPGQVEAQKNMALVAAQLK